MRKTAIALFLCFTSASSAAENLDAARIIQSDKAQIDTLRLVQQLGQRIDHTINAASGGDCDDTCRTVDGEGGLRRWEFFDRNAAVLVVLYPNYRADYTVHFDVIFAYAANEQPASTAHNIMNALLQDYFMKHPTAKSGPIEHHQMFHEFDERGDDVHYFAKGPSPFDYALWPPGVPNSLQNKLDKMYHYTYVLKFRPSEVISNSAEWNYQELGVVRPKASVNPSLSRPTHGRSD